MATEIKRVTATLLSVEGVDSWGRARLLGTISDGFDWRFTATERIGGTTLTQENVEAIALKLKELNESSYKTGLVANTSDT